MLCSVLDCFSCLGRAITVFPSEVAELEKCFPHGVYKVPCGDGFDSACNTLLANLRGDENIKGDVISQLQKALSGQQCLIWLDDVQDEKLMDVFPTQNFPGALLVRVLRTYDL